MACDLQQQSIPYEYDGMEKKRGEEKEQKKSRGKWGIEKGGV
jgi:hypothetical protein